jgi:hypothetical protein
VRRRAPISLRFGDYVRNGACISVTSVNYQRNDACISAAEPLASGAKASKMDSARNYTHAAARISA